MLSGKLIFGSAVMMMLAAAVLFGYGEHQRVKRLERDLAAKAIECRNTGIAQNAIGQLKQLEKEYDEENISIDADVIVDDFD